jgi:hypothetical protein
MASYLSDLMSRAAAVCELAVPGAVAKPFALYEQAAFPYFTLRIGETTFADMDEDRETRTYTVVIRLVIGHVTEGYEGDLETALYDYIVAVEDAFANRRGLQSPTYSAGMRYLNPRVTRLTRSTGLRVFQNIGIDAQQVGVEFTLVAPVTVGVQEVY